MRIGGLIVLWIFVCGASPLSTAIAHRDIERLEAWQSDAADEATLARGAALALRHHDDAALALLEPLALPKGSPAIRAGACFALADIYLRQTRYAQAHGALACVEDASGAPLTGEPAQVKADTAALAGEKPMALLHPAAGSLVVRRDRAGLIRIAVAVNDQSLKAVIDSDASFSVVSQSNAERLGLRILPAKLSILTASHPDQPMRLAVAERLKIGDAVLTDVVFAVLPDRAVRFGPDYRMETVIGLPVLVALGRIALVTDDGGEHLEYGRTAPAPMIEPNLILSGLDPFVLVTTGGGRLRLALDTAADKTSLNATALKELPALGNGAVDGPVSWQGAGGAAADYHSRVLSEWHFAVAGKPVTLKHVAILSAEEPDRDGMLGLDALRHARRWTIDFDAMCFWIED